MYFRKYKFNKKYENFVIVAFSSACFWQAFTCHAQTSGNPVDQYANSDPTLHYTDLKYGYGSARVPLGEWMLATPDERQEKINSQPDDFELAKGLVDANNNYPSNKIDLIRNRLIKKLKLNRDLLHFGLGYHEEVAPFAELKSRQNHEGLTHASLLGRYGQIIKTMCSEKHDDLPTIVLVNGRGTTPEAMFSRDRLDYSNSVAAIYAEQIEANVCAIELGHLAEPSGDRLGLSGRGFLLSSLIDYLWYLNHHEDGSFLIVGGISNGGHLAEFAGMLSDHVAGVISVGASARYDLPHSRYADASILKTSNYSLIDFLLRGPNAFELIYPKPLLISIGVEDAGFLKEQRTKPEILAFAKNTYRTEASSLFLNIFWGQHAHNPVNEALLISRMIELIEKQR